jgi:isoleucyl-tRNA synthetase
VRRSRDRFWAARGQDATTDADKEAAYQTLYTVLVTLAKLLAPVMPFLTEAMYQNLVRSAAPDAPVSVHHCLWPVTQPLAETEGVLVDSMSAVRQAATLGHSVRATGNLKVRQPLSRASSLPIPAAARR